MRLDKLVWIKKEKGVKKTNKFFYFSTLNFIRSYIIQCNLQTSYIIILYCSVLHCTGYSTLYSTALYGTVLYCTALIMLHHTVQ